MSAISTMMAVDVDFKLHPLLKIMFDINVYKPDNKNKN